MSAGKIIVLILWAVCTWCLLIVDNSIWVIAGRTLFWVLIVAHFCEFLIYLPKLKTVGGSMPKHFLNVMIYGFVYWKEVRPVDSAE